MLLFVPIAYFLVALPLAVGLGRWLKQASDQLPQQELQRRREAAGL